MAIKVDELMKWLKSLEPDDIVWIDDGGLTLETRDGAYMEVGGEENFKHNNKYDTDNKYPKNKPDIEFYDEDEDPKDFWKK